MLQWAMLTVYRRHLKACPYRSRKHRRCKCPLWVAGTFAGEPVKKSLDVTSWEAAQDKVRLWESRGRMEDRSEVRITVRDAVQKFLEDAEARHLKPGSIRRLRTIFNGQLLPFAESRGLIYLSQISVDELQQFRATLRNSANTSQKKLESLKAFFRFCCESKWIAENPGNFVKAPKVTQRPTMPFSEDEMKRIIAACDRYPNCHGNYDPQYGPKLKAFVLLLRHSGLRIGDALMLERKRLKRDRLFLYTQKTGTPVYAPLPPELVAALNFCPNRNPEYFFWTGESKPTTAAGNQRKYLDRLFKIAGVRGGKPHRFRDTFAVELLLADVPLERASILLGHSSIKVTEKYYSPWVKSRQDQLEADVRKTWRSIKDAVSPVNAQ
jgi:integrase/recombinase XerD